MSCLERGQRTVARINKWASRRAVKRKPSEAHALQAAPAQTSLAGPWGCLSPHLETKETETPRTEALAAGCRVTTEATRHPPLREIPESFGGLVARSQLGRALRKNARSARGPLTTHGDKEPRVFCWAWSLELKDAWLQSRRPNPRNRGSPDGGPPLLLCLHRHQQESPSPVQGPVAQVGKPGWEGRDWSQRPCTSPGTPAA